MSAVLKPSTEPTIPPRNYGKFNLHGVMQAPVTPLKEDFSFDPPAPPARRGHAQRWRASDG